MKFHAEKSTKSSLFNFQYSCFFLFSFLFIERTFFSFGNELNIFFRFLTEFPLIVNNGTFPTKECLNPKFAGILFFSDAYLLSIFFMPIFKACSRKRKSLGCVEECHNCDF